MAKMNENVNKNLNFFLPKNVLREFWEMEEDTLMKTKAVIWILKKKRGTNRSPKSTFCLAEIRLDLFCLLAATLHHKHTQSHNNFSHLLNRTFLHKFLCVFFLSWRPTWPKKNSVIRFAFAYLDSIFLETVITFIVKLAIKLIAFDFKLLTFSGRFFIYFFLFQLIFVFCIIFFHFFTCFEEDKCDPFRETTLKVILGYLFWWITAPLEDDPKICIKGIAKIAIQLALKFTFNTFGQIHQALNELPDEACKNTLAADICFTKKSKS